eukprot:6912268-Pyramimonas_sp.AAC.2
MALEAEEHYRFEQEEDARAYRLALTAYEEHCEKVQAEYEVEQATTETQAAGGEPHAEDVQVVQDQDDEVSSKGRELNLEADGLEEVRGAMTGASSSGVEDTDRSLQSKRPALKYGRSFLYPADRPLDNNDRTRRHGTRGGFPTAVDHSSLQAQAARDHDDDDELLVPRASGSAASSIAGP